MAGWRSLAAPALAAPVLAGLALAGRGLDWWLEEMRAMMPRRWREPRAVPAGLVAWRDGAGYRLAWHGRDGRADLAGDAPPAAPVTLCLPASAGLVRRIVLPAMPPADLRRLVWLDLDRLTPFPAEQVAADLEIETREDNRVLVAVGVVRRDHARDALAHARAAGIVPARLALAEHDGGPPRFDFRSVLPPGGTAGWRAVAPARLWGLAGGLVLVNLAIAGWRDQAALDDLAAQAQALRPQAAAARALRDSTVAEADRRARLRARRQDGDPLVLLAGLTRVLPDTVWIQRLEWDGAALRLAGWAGGPAEVLAALAADPAYRGARLDATTQPPRPARQPFAVVIERVDHADAPAGRP